MELDYLHAEVPDALDAHAAVVYEEALLVAGAYEIQGQEVNVFVGFTDPEVTGTEESCEVVLSPNL
jgi:hypothetical protein